MPPLGRAGQSRAPLSCAAQGRHTSRVALARTLGVMTTIVAVLVAFLLPLFMLRRGFSRSTAWLASAAVVPAFVIASEFVPPHSGGGASLWPVALVVGGFWGGVAAGLGTFVGGKLASTDQDT